MKHCLLLYCLYLYGFNLFSQNHLSDKIIERPLEDYIWDLSSLYANDEDWEKERAKIEREIAEFLDKNDFKIDSSQDLIRLLKSARSLSVRAGKMSVYGYLVSTVNQTSEKTKRQSRIGQSLETKANEVLSGLPESILEVPQDSLTSWMAASEYEPFRRQINEILENRDHYLFGKASQINNSLKRWSQLSYDNYAALRNSRISWPKVNDSTSINFNNYRFFFSEDDPSFRNGSLTNFYNKLSDFEDAFANYMTGRIEADHLRAVNENYANGIEAIFSKRDGYSDEVVDTMIKVVNDNIHVFHEMLDLMLQFSESKNPSFPDLYYSRSKFNSSRTFSIDETLQSAVAIYSPLGEEYIKRLTYRINDNRMHLPLLPEKSGGAFATYPSVGGMKSFMVLPYYGSYSVAAALTGGLALLMSYTDMPKERPFLHRYDPPIYSNAIIYAGRNLFDDHMVQEANEDSEKLAYLMNSLFNNFRLFFNHVMLADFEKEVQQKVVIGEALSGQDISNLYLQKMRQYYGAENLMDVPGFIGSDWITFDVMFSSYDQMFWPPAYACGIEMAKGFQKRDKKIMQLFSGVLGNRSTDRTKDLIGDVIDLESEAPYKAVVDRVSNQLREAKHLAARVNQN